MMVVGVNGVGKTTTIGKLAHQFRQKGLKVVLGAADTFRAAAIDQLQVWADRVDVPIVKQNMGSDPASVAYDTLTSAVAQDADVVIIDTAGRLHNKVNLMNELSKIKRVMQKVVGDAPHDVLLVLDGSTGQNAFEQAKQFIPCSEDYSGNPPAYFTVHQDKDGWDIITYYTSKKRGLFAGREGDEWVYVLSNPSIPNMVKIGYTANDPFIRAHQISRGTGVPEGFEVEWAYKCYKGERIEKETHKHWTVELNIGSQRNMGKLNHSKKFGYYHNTHDLNTVR